MAQHSEDKDEIADEPALHLEREPMEDGENRQSVVEHKQDPGTIPCGRRAR